MNIFAAWYAIGKLSIMMAENMATVCVVHPLVQIVNPIVLNEANILCSVGELLHSWSKKKSLIRERNVLSSLTGQKRWIANH